MKYPNTPNRGWFAKLPVELAQGGPCTLSYSVPFYKNKGYIGQWHCHV